MVYIYQITATDGRAVLVSVNKQDAIKALKKAVKNLGDEITILRVDYIGEAIK